MTISSTTIHLHPITRYFFQNSSFPLNEQDGSVQERMARLKEEYSIHGKRISLDAAIICHLHKHPHLMILNFGGTFYKLYGGRKGQDTFISECLPTLSFP